MTTTARIGMISVTCSVTAPRYWSCLHRDVGASDAPHTKRDGPQLCVLSPRAWLANRVLHDYDAQLKYLPRL